MGDKHKPRPVWTDAPDEHDYPAAEEYLSLVLADEDKVRAIVAELRSDDALIEHRRVNDVIRASGLAVLPRDDYEIRKNLKRIREGVALSPVLLVVDDVLEHALVIADGFHRVCASYYTNPRVRVACKIARVKDIHYAMF